MIRHIRVLLVSALVLVTGSVAILWGVARWTFLESERLERDIGFVLAKPFQADDVLAAVAHALE